MAHRKIPRELAHRERSGGEPFEYLAPGWIAEGLECRLVLVSVH
jgi:hypothetical protein